jgi:signal transduction histidine kinase
VKPAESRGRGARQLARRRSLEPLLGVARGLVSRVPREALLEAIAAGPIQLRADAVCTLRLQEPEQGGLHLGAIAGPSGAASRLGALDETLAPLALQHPQPLVIADVRLEGRADLRAIWREQRYAFYWGLALPGPTGPLGVLGLALPAGVPALEPDERHGLELYAAQAALALRNGDLVATVERQGQMLESARGELVEAAKLLALGHLVSDVVHEVSNLLGAVTLRMDGLLEGPRDQHLEGQVHLLQAHCRQIGDLIGELRRFAITGSWPRAPLDLGASVERILYLRRGRIEARGVKVVFERGSRLAEALADRPSLERALLALILESEAAIPANTGGRMTLRLTGAEDGDGRWVRLDIEDDGPPFAPAVLQQLFDPFAARGPGRGPSVGLAAAHAVIEAHGGRLTAENRRGGGVVLRVELPAAI